VCSNVLEAVMLSQAVWDQLLETEKKKVQALEESYAEKMRAHSVSVNPQFVIAAVHHILV